MKILIIDLPKYNFVKHLYIFKKYRSDLPIIPIGCDCHIAYSLDKLGLRKKSLPFDWLNTDSISGLNYVLENIKSKFEYFLSKLMINHKGQIVSEKYPYAEFMHEKNLIDNELDRAKVLKRIERFKTLIELPLHFVYSVNSISIISEEAVAIFYKSVIDFRSHIRETQKLCIILRFDENYNENKSYCDKLYEYISKIDNVKIIRYCRKKSQYGVWGNEYEYPKLYRNLGVKIVSTFPKIYIK